MSDAVDRVTREVSQDLEVPAEVDLHEDRTRELRTPGFSRMRTEWEGNDAIVVAHVMGQADNLLLMNFADAFGVMHELYEIVREPVCDENTGLILKDAHGFTVWKRSPSGVWIEDYSRLGHKEKQHLLFQITTRIFEWEQKAANAWGEAMFAKAMFEERFAATFQSTPGTKPTVDDRTQFARGSSTEERYFAIFQSLYSRKAEALVRSLTLLGQRLKDVTAS